MKVHQIYSIISRHRHYLQLNGDICRCLVHFCVRIKDVSFTYFIKMVAYTSFIRCYLLKESFSLNEYCILLMQFERAYKMVSELQEMGFKPTTAMYNAIMAGYFREVSLLDFIEAYVLAQIFNYFSTSIIMLVISNIKFK